MQQLSCFYTVNQFKTFFLWRSSQQDASVLGPTARKLCMLLLHLVISHLNTDHGLWNEEVSRSMPSWPADCLENGWRHSILRYFNLPNTTSSVRSQIIWHQLKSFCWLSFWSIEQKKGRRYLWTLFSICALNCPKLPSLLTDNIFEVSFILLQYIKISKPSYSFYIKIIFNQHINFVLFLAHLERNTPKSQTLTTLV